MDTLADETPEARQQRLQSELHQLESILYPALQRDFRRNEADAQFAIAKTATWAGGLDTLAIGLTALAGSPAAIASTAVAAVVCFGLAYHHFTKGIQLAQEANADPCIHDVCYEGTLEPGPGIYHL
jgi:hypothetical protein